MATRYRLIWVDNTRSYQKGKILFDFPSTTYNGYGPNQTTRCQDYQSLQASLISVTNGVFEDLTPNMLYFRMDGTSNFDQIDNFGFHNWTNNHRIQIGDRFYVNVWDNNHSYLEVTGISETGTTESTVSFNYCAYDGTVAYQTMCKAENQNGNLTIWMLPWLGCRYNLEIASDYSLYNLKYYYDDRQGYLNGAWLTIETISCTSLENAQKFWTKVDILDPNPYENADETAEGGGDPGKQNWDDNSDAITPDGMPTKGALASGMVSVFSPSDTEVANLADMLFSYNFFDWLQKNLQNLEEIFVSFGVVPFSVTKGSTVSVTWLGFDISSFTHPVTLTKAAQQYYEIDMGSVALDGSDDRIHASDSVFDYSPFSKLGIYLPFIGYQELDIDECRGNTLNLVYRVDIVSGSCVALISLNSDKDRCIYQFSGNCLTQIPLGSVDMSGIVSGSIAIATAAASAGATAAVASAGDALTAENLNSGKLTEAGAKLQNSQHMAQVANAGGSLASATVNGIMGMKPNYKHSGAIGASGGLFAVKQPYLFLITPREAIPRNYQHFCGLPCNITGNLGDFSGFTVVEDIRLNGLVATSAEVEEIYQLLKSGVIV